MKKLLVILLASFLAVPSFAADKKEPAKKPAAEKKEVKHHKKAEGTKISDTKPDTPQPAKKKK